MGILVADEASRLVLSRPSASLLAAPPQVTRLHCTRNYGQPQSTLCWLSHKHVPAGGGKMVRGRGI